MATQTSFSPAASITVAVVGCFVLLGWTFDIMFRVFPALVAMKANAALAFVLSARSLWLLARDSDNRLRRLAQLCAAMVILISLLTLAEYLLGRDLRIDKILFKDASTGAAESQPRRMDPATAVMFLLLGVELSMLGPLVKYSIEVIK
jgi:hypothetical protein